MDVAAFLEEVCAIPGHSGMEGAAAARIAQEFSKYTKDVFVDKLGSVHGVMGSRGPRVLVCAHMDEVGLIAGSVADNGFIRLWQLGGVDPAPCRDARSRSGAKSPSTASSARCPRT